MSSIKSCVIARESQSSAPFARLRSIDALRGVMCAGIALYHFTPYFFDNGDWEYGFSRYFSYFTDMFAVFAGFFSQKWLFNNWKEASYKDFLVNKIARLYPLHLITAAFYIVLAVPVYYGIIAPADSSRYSFTAVIPHLTLTHAWGFGPSMALNYPSWMISGIFACYISMPILAKIHTLSRWILPSVLALFLLLSGIYEQTVDSYDDAITAAGALRIAPSFLFGILVGSWNIDRWNKWISITLLAVSTFTAFGVAQPLEGVARLIAVYALVFAVIAADKAAVWTPLSLRPLQSVGKFSFGVYLWHGVVATVLFRVIVIKLFRVRELTELGNSHEFLACLLIALGMLLSFFLASLSLRIIEKPGSKLFIKLFQSKPEIKPILGASAH